jgi:hypothetical protein
MSLGLILVGFLRERKPKSSNEVARRSPGFVKVEGAKILRAPVVPIAKNIKAAATADSRLTSM